MFGQPVNDGFQVERSLADPVGQDCAVQIKARPRENLALAIQRQMISIFADQHMGERRLGRQTAHDQMAGRRGLGHPVGAGPAVTCSPVCPRSEVSSVQGLVLY